MVIVGKVWSHKTNNYTLQESLTINDDLAMISDIGKKKRTNQDAGKVGIRVSDNTYVLVVADGVSSSQSASLAANTAVNRVFEELMCFPNFNEEIMQRAIECANKAVKSLPFESFHNLDEPETTIVAAMIKDNKIIIGWVGDSRAYAVSDKKVYLLTEDDSWVNKMIKEKKLSPEQAKKHPKSHVITQCLGLRRMPITIHTDEFELESNEGVLLCTDGLWGLTKIEPIDWSHPANIEAWLKINKANRNGGYDNITVAIKRPAKK